MQACGGRLGKVNWFKSAWQAGGASTGYSTITQPDGSTHEVVVKLPVGPSEYRWTALLGGGRTHDGSLCEGLTDHTVPAPCHSTPRVLACGTYLGGYDLAWLVVEKLEGSPLSVKIDEPSVRDLLSAAVSWYEWAGKLRNVGETELPPPKDWEKLLAKGRDVIHNHGIAEEQRWNTAIRSVQKALPTLLRRWNERPISTWCHGDLHFGNALRRSGMQPGSGCVLIDLALVHPGHWVEDAVYLERLYWAKPDMLCGIKPVSEMARLMRERQVILNHEDYSMLAAIRRVLMAASVPAFLLHEGHPKYVHAALEIIEKHLPNVAR